MVEQLAQLRVLDRRQQFAQFALQLLHRDLGLGRQVLGRVLVRLGLAQVGDLDLRPPALADLEDAGDEDGGAGAAEGVEGLRLLPADRLGGAGGVADREPQPGLAVALAPQLPLADREDAADALAVLEIAEGDPDGGLGGRRLDGLRHAPGERLDLRLLRHRLPKVETGADAPRGCI